MRLNQQLGLVVLAAAFSVTSYAGAGTITTAPFDSTLDPFFHFGGTVGSFTADWAFDTDGSLTLDLVNTTSGTSPTGAITGIAFNAAPGTTLTFLGAEGDDDGPWSEDSFVPGNLGNFDTIVTVDGLEFAQAGNGTTGVEVGEAGWDFPNNPGVVRFSWTVSGAGLSSLTVWDFLDLDANSEGFGFAIRMKGVGSPPADSDTIVLIPLPAALPMGLAGLAGVVIMRRRTTRAKHIA